MTVMKINEHGRTDIYEVVDKIPKGYEVWNIGNHAPKGYLPLCLRVAGTYTIQPNALKALKFEGDDYNFITFASVRYGFTNRENTKRRLPLLKSTKKVEVAKRALEIYERISE